MDDSLDSMEFRDDFDNCLNPVITDYQPGNGKGDCWMRRRTKTRVQQVACSSQTNERTECSIWSTLVFPRSAINQRRPRTTFIISTLQMKRQSLQSYGFVQIELDLRRQQQQQQQQE